MPSGPYTGSASEVRVTSNGAVIATVEVGGGVYDSAKFVIPDGVTKYDLGIDSSNYKVNGNIFNNTLVHGAFFTEISTDQDITLYLNMNDNDPIEIGPVDGPWKDAHIQLRSLFVTNTSGQPATIRILMF